MHVSTKWLLAAALVVPTGMTVVGAASGPAGAAAGTSCAKSNGVAKFKPALPVAGSAKTVKPTITVNHAKMTRCKGGGVTRATFDVTAKFRTPTNCSTLLSGSPSPKPPIGTLVTTWNTGAKSTAKVTLNTVSGQATETHVTGTVTRGQFKGLSLDATLSFAPKQGDCVSTPLKSVTFTNDGALTIG